MSFRPKERLAILRRDGFKSVESGETEELEAAHINHSRKYERYHKPDNGRTLTTEEHYLDHYNRHNLPDLGLPDEGNQAALWLVWQRLPPEKRRRLPPPESILGEENPFPQKRRG